MKSGKLKIVRVIISLLFFFAVALLFVDIKNILPVSIYNAILYLQFIPSLLKFFYAMSFAAAGFFIVLLITLFSGRVYCSTICPLGTLQDIINFISGKVKKKRKFGHLKETSWLRYSLLVLTTISLITGYLVTVNLLDPYSNTGRIFSGLLRPVIAGSNNLISSILEIFEVFTFYPVVFKGNSFISLLFPIVFLAIIIWLSFTKGRLYCNTICPVGTFLGLISKFSLYKIDIKKDSCKSCGICEKVCKSSCIDTVNKSIDYSRCVNCYNCLDVCPSDGIIFKNSLKKKKEIVEVMETDYSKRDFITSTLIFTLGLAGKDYAYINSRCNHDCARCKSKNDCPHFNRRPTKIPNIKKYPVTPPGSGSIEHFNDSCTACHLCVSACPTGVLQPSFLEYGFTGMLQPRMDYHKNFCNFECTRCADVCPNGAIKHIEIERKKLTQLGKVKFIKDNCIVHTESTDCGACSEHCPTKAVRMVPMGKLFAPEIRDEYCIGCGACEYACPVKPHKAIYVEGNPVHLTAKKPESKKIDQNIDLKEDFPF